MEGDQNRNPTMSFDGTGFEPQYPSMTFFLNDRIMPRDVRELGEHLVFLSVTYFRTIHAYTPRGKRIATRPGTVV